MPPSPLSDLANCDLLIANQLQCNPQNQSFPMSNVPKKNPFSAVLSGPKLCWVVQHVLKCHMDSILRNSRRVILLGTPCVTVPQIDHKSEMWSILLGAVHILRNMWWGGGGLPDLLQYYIEGGLLNLLQYYRGGVFKIYYNITVLKGKWKVVILFQL